MSEIEKKTLRQRLDELSRQLDARVRDLKEKGEFSDTRETTMKELHRRQADLVQRVDAAEHTGASWELAKAELARDFSALFDDFVEIEQNLDSGRMKKR